MKYVRNTGTNTGVLEYWNTGILECWNNGMKRGVLEYWKEKRNAGMVE